MNNDTYCIFTTEEGGKFLAWRCTWEKYEQWKAERRIWDWHDVDPTIPGAKPALVYRPFFMAFVRVEDNFDFGFGMSRDEQAASLTTA